MSPPDYLCFWPEADIGITYQLRFGRRRKISQNKVESHLGLEGRKMPIPLLGKILCWLGFHDFHIIRESFSFGGGGIETVECNRCGLRRIREA